VFRQLTETKTETKITRYPSRRQQVTAINLMLSILSGTAKRNDVVVTDVEMLKNVKNV